MAENSPRDIQATERLKRWAIDGAGAALFQWGTPGDFERCRVFYKDKVPGRMLDGWCANLHKQATGAPPGHAPGEAAARAAEGSV